MKNAYTSGFASIGVRVLFCCVLFGNDFPVVTFC